ncbi:MAG: hypothetical protein LBK99_10860 [Opitutaceae bacterium]|jgi:hypothetical protein|nr:hypothetical protein [Opitutaceae bacterium]
MSSAPDSISPESDDTADHLRETPVAPARIPTVWSERQSWTPAKLFADHAFAARMWFLVACVALGFCIVQPVFIIRALRTHERVVILDSAGTFSVSPLLGFEDAKGLYENITLWATLALLQRNPKGFDFPDLLARMCLADALAKAQDDIAKNRDEFELKQIHQKPEVLRIEILRTREDQVLVKAEGQLVRTGVFERQLFGESPKFTLNLTLVRNPDMASNKRYPLAVWNYDYTLR